MMNIWIYIYDIYIYIYIYLYIYEYAYECLCCVAQFMKLYEHITFPWIPETNMKHKGF